MNSFILCSPQHAFLGVIGLLACGLLTAGAMETSSVGSESLAASHEERRVDAEGGAGRTTLASVEFPNHYYR